MKNDESAMSDFGGFRFLSSNRIRPLTVVDLFDFGALMKTSSMAIGRRKSDERIVLCHPVSLWSSS